VVEHVATVDDPMAAGLDGLPLTPAVSAGGLTAASGAGQIGGGGAKSG
jgi:hypothetical protein